MNSKVAEIKKRFDEACVKVIPTCTFSFQYIAMYTEMNKEYPHIILVGSEGEYLNKDLDPNDFEDYNSCFSDVYDELDDYSTTNKSIRVYENINLPKTLIKLHENLKDSCYFVREENVPLIIGDKLLIFYDNIAARLTVMQDSEKLREDIAACIVDDKMNEDIRTISYITHDSNGFAATKITVDYLETDIKKLYNDDIPDKEILDFLNSNNSGLLLFHGECGSGKTNYIRNLMYRLPSHKFIILDNSVFDYITDASFIKLLMNNKNSVIILEDCEDMLVDRVSGNGKISTLLNLSDGILGDSFKFKFICTFNTNISSLDKALLRKGRMHLKYEFKKLCAEKTYNLGKDLGKNIPEGVSLTLADIFNYGVDNGVSNKKTAIGFTKN